MKKFLFGILCLLSATQIMASDPAPIRIMVAYPPGGPVGNLAQIVQKTLSTELKNPVIIEYRPGAGGSIGTAHALANLSDPILILNNSAIILNTFKIPQPYSERQLTPLIHLGRMPLILVTSRKSKIDNFQDLRAKQVSRSMTYGSAGIGSVGHLTMERLNLSMKQDLLHVPYRGTSAVMADILSGHIDLAWVFVSPAVAAHVRQKDLVPLAIDNQKRLPDFANVPTLPELGFQDSGNFSWFAIFQAGKWQPDLLRQVQRIMQETLLDSTRSIMYREFGLIWEAKDVVPDRAWLEHQRSSLATVVKRVSFEE